MFSPGVMLASISASNLASTSGLISDQIPGPAQSICRRFEPCDDQRHQLIEEFFIRKRVTTLVFCLQIHREKIESCRPDP